MSTKKLFFFFLVISFLTIGAVLAQTLPIRGKVVLRKADGTTIPVSNALIEPYRTDISKGKLPSAKTDKNGNFAFAGLPLGQTFALVVSAPGIKPEIFPNVKAGMDDITITVFEGDGKRYTEEEVREALKKGLTSTPVTTQMSEEDKKKLEEEAKRRAEYEEKRKKVEETNATIRRALDEGVKAFEAQNYDLAIAKFEEGIMADPEFEGSAPILYNNKAQALIRRAINRYNQSLSEKDPSSKAQALSQVKQDLLDALDSSEKALQILSKATSTDANVQKSYEQNKVKAMGTRVEVYRLLFKTNADNTKAMQALEALREYEAIEKDPAQISKTRLGLADAIRDSGDTQTPIELYKKVLEVQSDNLDAMAGLGLCLVNQGFLSQDKTLMQEGLNILQQFADNAPDNHPLKLSVKSTVEYLKTEEKLTPQKTTRPTRKRGQ